MQVFHTAGEPPSKGKNNLPNKGWRTKSTAALSNKVLAKTAVWDRKRKVWGFIGLFLGHG